ncbi:MAG: class I poly(R)-hydroxyalkanoic acid synthase [Gammaproteobacteria bacterium]|nr:MAG: class I poly(R)-hydroxyalkanoic acid synthase [Gammaproteobacteria bacterium]
MDPAIKHIIETWQQLASCIEQHPDKLFNMQSDYWQDYLALCQETGNTPWQQQVAFHFIKKSYSLLSQHLQQWTENITTDENSKIAKKLTFYTKQLLDALSPNNFVATNPDIIAKTIEMDGGNFINGMQQFLADLEQGKGLLTITPTDLDFFKPGENIACTKGHVIYQNDLMQLIHYQPTTEKTYTYPLLIIPPWINKYYILDLQSENSLVKWLVDQGWNVFMISWVNAKEAHRKKNFSHYLQEGPLAALKIIKKIKKIDHINVLGYCIGGTLLGCTLAYLAKKQDSCIKSATFLTTLFDFSEPGDLGNFIDANQLAILEKHMESKGYLDGKIMSAVFNLLRANDLIWSAFVNYYLKGEKPKPFDLLYWNADPINIPEHVHRFYLRNMYLHNYLVQSNKLKLSGTPIDLRCITIPSYFLAAQDDHIVPWSSSYKSSHYLSGPVRFVLTTSGHVAGVVNPPYRNKYSYWTSNQSHQHPEDYLFSATLNPGSWWDDWATWLKNYSGELQSVDCDISKNIIEDAPGSYVKVRFTL